MLRWDPNRIPLSDQNDKLLLQIETDYITDPERRSSEWWYEQVSHQIALETLRTYAQQNKWLERRQAFWRGVQAQWLRQRGQELIQARVQELAEFKDLRLVLLQFCQPRRSPDGTLTWPIKPNSYEGMLRALINVDDAMDRKREAVASIIDPMLAQVERERAEDDGDDERNASELPFDKDEMRSVAHNLLTRRRAQRRARLEIDDDDAEQTAGDEEADPAAEESSVS